MSMSSHVVGFRPPDEKWQQMKAIFDAYVAADIAVPKEVREFFDWRDPDPIGVEVNLDKPEGVKDWKGDMQEGLEVELAKLPKHITHLRFINSW